MAVMDVSVIIVNYNTKELTKNCIDSIVSQTNGVSYEIILVDNASSDGSVEVFENDNRINFIKSDKNLGFGKANNLGYKYSHGKYIFLLNSDTLLLNNAIKLFYDKMEAEDEHIGCMGCLLQDADGNRVHSYADFPQVGNVLAGVVWSKFKYFVQGKMNMDDPKKMEENPSFFQVDFVTGADLFIRRTVIEKCGLFDQDFFMYYEDPEMEFRFRKNGYFSYIYSAPKIIHLEGKSFEMNNKKFLVKLRSNMLYLSKTKPKWKVQILRMLLLAKYPIMVKNLHLNQTDRIDLWKAIFV